MKNTQKMIQIDGSAGEGGGQILRSALTLSMITGQAFQIVNLRAKRPKPGLMRQHLTAVRAAAQICGADISKIALNTTNVTFTPGLNQGGNYHFATGSAGNVILVAQTVLPALLFADQPSEIILEGGTHTNFAPCFEFFQNSYLPLLHKMGADIKCELIKPGFYPAGGGKIKLTISPLRCLTPLTVLTRGAQTGIQAKVALANLGKHIATREMNMIEKCLTISPDDVVFQRLQGVAGSANYVQITLTYDHLTDVLTDYGKFGVRAEKLAANLCDQAITQMSSPAAVGPYLADQLLLPLALAGSGQFSMAAPSDHCLSHAVILEKFLPVTISFNQQQEDDWIADITPR